MNFAARRTHHPGPEFFLRFLIVRGHFFQESGEGGTAVLAQLVEVFVAHNRSLHNRCLLSAVRVK